MLFRSVKPDLKVSKVFKENKENKVFKVKPDLKVSKASKVNKAFKENKALLAAKNIFLLILLTGRGAQQYQHLIVEFELALQLGHDLPHTDQPWTASRIQPMVECAYPCLELADDRHANYNHLKTNFFTLVAENAWNHGAILGHRIEPWQFEKLWQTLGVARVNGEKIGHGKSQDVMGHPLNALAWLANECQRRGRPVLAGQWVTTGSWVASFFPVTGQTLRFDFDNLAGVDVHIV